jgi:hypothetical protein
MEGSMNADEIRSDDRERMAREFAFVGEMVYYLDERGMHFGYLVKRGYKWATVRHGEDTRRVPVSGVRLWPPSQADAPGRPVKRGRA